MSEKRQRPHPVWDTITDMELDFDTCYKAIQSRDSRFDGRFFTAVTSTGIYCRPVCPAQTPLRRNVRFYRYAKTAEAAGFRACRRCRPEANPSSPDWNVKADLVARALQLIAEGVMDTEGVTGLAARLAVSERHLHREVVAHVGVGPLQIARTRRTQTARLLLDQTTLPLTEVAFASGFESIRQFNETMRASFGCSPTELRRRGASPLEGSGWLTLRLGYRPPLDTAHLFDFLARRAVPGIEQVDGSRYRRVAAIEGSAAIIDLEPRAYTPHVLLRLRLGNLGALGSVVERCRWLLDLDADPAAIGDLLSADPALAPLLESRPGLRMPGTFDSWELAVRAVLGQQVSVAGARTLAGRLVASLGEALAEPDGQLTHLFPSPQAVADADLSGLGLTRGRAAALRALAEAVSAGQLVLDRRADREETVRHLLTLPGIGPWTASYIAMRALGDPDAFPATDLGLRRAMERLGSWTSQRDLLERAEQWRPWRAYAAMHLWASLDDTHSMEEDQ